MPVYHVKRPLPPPPPLCIFIILIYARAYTLLLHDLDIWGVWASENLHRQSLINPWVLFCAA